MIEAAITAARLCGAAVLCVYFCGIAVKMIAESLDELRRRREKREKERLEREWRRIPTPPPYRPAAPVTTPPPDKGSDVQPPARWIDPQDEPPPQGCSAEERAEMLAEFEETVRRFNISPCRICANYHVSNDQWPCSSCAGGQRFIAKWRRGGEVVHTKPLPVKEQR